MSRYEEVKVRFGFGDNVEVVTLKVSEGDLAPWDLDSKLSVVGGRADRVDAIAKVTGTAKYAYDRNLPKMLFGRILRCPHANANVRSVDLEAARKMPGVVAALDLTQVFRNTSMRFSGEEVAAVAAESEAAAEEAVRAIAVDYEVLPFAVRTRDAMAEGAPQVGRGNQRNVVPMVRRGRGDSDDDVIAKGREEAARGAEEFEVAIKGADALVEADFETQCQTHTALETHGMVCAWDGEDLLCYASTQGTFSVAGDLRGRTGARNTRVLGEYVGGGFGAKFGAGREGVAGALLAKEAGRPVKLMLDRREEHLAVGNRPDSIQKIRMGVKKDGTILGYQVRSFGTPGSGAWGAGANNTAFYELGKVDKVEHAVRTNTGAQRAMRAPGYPQGVYALEQMMDIAAERIGMDPLEFRLKNDRHKIRPHEFRLGAERIGWKEKRKVAPGAGRGTVKTGVGCAGSLWFQAGGRGAACKVRLHKDGTVEVRNGSQDIGTGTRTIMGMVAAEELGLELDQVETYIGDTNDPQGPGSGGSTTAPTVMPAVRSAAHRAKLELLGLVAEAQGWDADELDLKGGRVVRKDGRALASSMSFRDACRLMVQDAIEVEERRPRNIPEGFSDTNAGAQFAEVEVDTETGEVRVKKVVAVSDAGKVMNAKTSESQVRGGVIQGVSYALFEDRLMDHQLGHMINADMEAYKIAGPADTPEIDTVLVDVANGLNSTSVMGLGEPPIIATAAAIANAVHHAIGVRITSIPITPKKVLEALAQKEKK